MGLAHLFIPRRKENVLKVILLILCCGAIIYYYRFLSNQLIGGTLHQTLIKQGLKRGNRYVRTLYSIPRDGPGENGQGVYFQGAEKEQVDKDMKDWFMNVKASDMISLDRSLPDARRAECKDIIYDLKKLPKVNLSSVNLALIKFHIVNLGFSWALHFTWEPMSEVEKSRRKSVTEYIRCINMVSCSDLIIVIHISRSPTMAGGLLAANRDYFFEVGSYDSMMDIWGGENLEISFRVWMCGGSIEFIPCSHVGHIFRSGHPYNMTGSNGNKDVHGTNSKRLAEVWMDEYKRLYYMHRSDLLCMMYYQDKDVGDLSERKALRSSLGCKSFRWYLDNIIPGKFVMDEDVIAFGALYTVVNGYHMCIDTLQRDEKSVHNLGVFPCQGKGSSPQIVSFMQMISLSRVGHLRRETNCAHSVVSLFFGEKGNVQMVKCDEHSEKWSYEHSMMKNTKTGLCLSTAGLRDGDDIILEICNNSSMHQKWTFVNPNAAKM
uniref:Ricin B-type lectin domain-containing protein n=1 Tax=Heterorhabditis bacteriophora TaxID=37862 RepID=A0A1I7XT93_HETBA